MSFPNEYIAGALGGVSGIIVGHPFDTTKLQLQVRTSGDHKVAGTGAAFYSVWKQGFKKGLFRGMAFPVSTYALVNSVFFGVYGSTLCHLEPDESVTPSSLKVYLAGCFAGAVQLVFSCPIDVCKCTMQAQIPLTRPPTATTGSIDGAPRAQPKTIYPLRYYNSPIECLRDIARNQGIIKGWYRGLGSMFIRDVPSFGLYLLVYECLSTIMIERGLSDERGMFASAFAGGVAGCASWAPIMPFDFIKSRLQTDHGGRYNGFMDCARQSVKAAGWRVLFRGTGITLVRAFPVNAITFLVYSESLKKLDDINPPSFKRTSSATSQNNSSASLS